MPRRSSFFLVLACFAGLFLACFFPVLFQGQQFGFRDAAHYYYPLYQRVQQEWDAGRIPLWEIEENAGMPLLGNPTAAVLYPLKVIYAIFPYAWGARLYSIAHTALAFVAMVVMMRSWGTSWTGSGLSALAYAFGAPILFQSANIIFLVGAAWLPLGVRAMDQWVRRGRRRALIELAVVLSMQVLGGEPQSAYLLGLAGVGYAAGLAWHRAAERQRAWKGEVGLDDPWSTGWARLLVGMAVLAFWIVTTLVMGCLLPRFRLHELPPQPLPGMAFVPMAVAAAWAVGGVAFFIYWRRQGWRFPLGLTWLGLLGAATLAVALSAAQFLPVLEFTQRTSRVAHGGTHEIYPFSLDPARLLGLIWPEVLGDAFTGNTSWAELLRPPGAMPRVWVPSLYLGGMTLVLALATFSLRRGGPWRVWLSSIVLVSALGSLGEYTSPLWGVRALAEGRRPVDPKPPDHKLGPREITIDLKTVWAPLRPLIERLGPLDPENTTPIRQDDFLRDGDGGLYWLMSTFLPGFRQFRYPAKLFTLTTLGLCALAGVGWDVIARRGPRRVAILSGILATTSLILLVMVMVRRAAIIEWIGAAKIVSLYGPTDPAAAYQSLVAGLIQGMIVFSMGGLAFRLQAGRPRLASVLVLAIATIDLGLANRRFILTVPQSTFETKPEVLRLIEEAEQANPSPGPYRIHRMPSWEPPYWHTAGSPDRAHEVDRWERNTLQPKYGIPLGVQYAHVIGVAELYEYEWYYGGFPRHVRDREMARILNIGVGDQVVYFPRRTFDMWNTRYFIVPMWPNGWMDQFRGFASLTIDSESVYPKAGQFRGPDAHEKEKEWYEKSDYRILRNRREHPRAWVAHEARIIETTKQMEADEEHKKAMMEITYEDDPLWTDSSLHAFDCHRYVWIDRDQRPALAPYITNHPRDSSESVKVTYPSPQRVELEVTLKSPGIVILADIDYPGWALTIDGVPAPIYPVNRAMRGAAVDKGPHHLVYTYAPRSFRIGLVVTVVGLLATLAMTAFCYFRPVEPIIADKDGPESSEGPHD